MKGSGKYFIPFRPSEQFYIFFICLLLAFLFWAIITLSKSYTAFIRFPVKYVNIPENKIIANKIPDYISLEINTYGFAILTYHYGKIDTLAIDVNTFITATNDMNTGLAFLPIRNLVEEISKQLNTGIHLSKIPADTIFLNFEKAYSKLVDVKLNISLSFEKQYFQSGDIKLSPSKILVSGVKNRIDTMQFILTKKISYASLNKSITNQATFFLSDDKLTNISISPSTVQYKIPVEKFTEGNLEIPITLINLPESLKLNIFPDKIKVTYLVALSKYEKITSDMFSFSVDYDDIKHFHEDKLKISLLQSPSFVKFIRYSPTKVEYIIKK